MRLLLTCTFALVALLGCGPAKPAPTPAATKLDTTQPAPETIATPASDPAASTKPGTITVKGSDTMILIAQRWAEVYMQAHPEVTVQVTGGGSGTGIAAVIDGTCNLANASRPIKAEEVQQGQTKGSAIIEHKVALDALCVVVNAANPVKDLSLAQVKAIFTGAITNWSAVGGADEPIICYARESNSGTYSFFKEHILKDADFLATAQTMPGTAALATAVAKDSKGIGFGGAAYFGKRTDIHVVGIKLEKDSLALTPLLPDGAVDEAAIRSLTYPISRYLYCYTAGEPTGDLKAYLDWILSDEGQQLARELEYVPLRAM
ncbi:MAG: PstS family phosphate ABC transporter substrate-binding protein [bacterium]